VLLPPEAVDELAEPELLSLVEEEPVPFVEELSFEEEPSEDVEPASFDELLLEPLFDDRLSVL
jgi:hypothetical protein